MFKITQPRGDASLRGMIRSDAFALRRTPAQTVDQLVALQAREARRQSVFASIETGGMLPPRWLRSEPRQSAQYAGHMATTAARDRRLTPQAKALLVVLRARCGNGTRTATCKTTLAHIMGVCTRSIGRYIADLMRFGYIDAAARKGPSGLYTGLVVTITEKVLPCFRNVAWLSGWLAQNLGDDGGYRDRTELSHTNHSKKDFTSLVAVHPSG